MLLDTPSTAFVPNPGLADGTLLFRSLGTAGTLFFAQHELILLLSNQSRSSTWFNRLPEENHSETQDATSPTAVRLQFLAANPEARLMGQEQLTGVVNYYLGNDPNQWKTNVPTFGRLVYEELYPGIDLIYQGNEEGALKSTFMIAPGANPETIRWRYEGASKVKLSKGELLVGTDEVGEEPLLIERAPQAWQVLDGKHKEVRVRYVIHNDGSIGFALGRYNASQPLVIDPTLDYGTYWGDVGCDGAYHIALDSSNNVYITGTTNSEGFPPADPSCDQTEYFDIYITKLDPSKSGANQHIYTTYIGGSNYEITVGIGVDDAGNAYAAGFTESDDLPTTQNAYQKIFKEGIADGMVIRVNANGTVQYLSYLGGNESEELMQMAVGSDSLLYVIGFTDSNDFPVTGNAYSSTLQENDAFVSVIDTFKSGNDSLVYSTFFGGSGRDEGYAIVTDNGSIFLAGTTLSNDLPLKNAIQTTNGVGVWYGDVYVAKIDPSQSGTNHSFFPHI